MWKKKVEDEIQTESIYIVFSKRNNSKDKGLFPHYIIAHYIIFYQSSKFFKQSLNYEKSSTSKEFLFLDYGNSLYASNVIVLLHNINAHFIKAINIYFINSISHTSRTNCIRLDNFPHTSPPRSCSKIQLPKVSNFQRVH